MNRVHEHKSRLEIMQERKARRIWNYFLEIVLGYIFIVIPMLYIFFRYLLIGE